METLIRWYRRDGAGRICDLGLETDLSETGGVCPAVGDQIVAPTSATGSAGRGWQSGRIWTVRERIFSPKYMGDYVALVVEERGAAASEEALF